MINWYWPCSLSLWFLHWRRPVSLVIHSFIHYGDLYSAPSRLLLRSAPDPCTAKEKSFELTVKAHTKRIPLFLSLDIGVGVTILLSWLLQLQSVIDVVIFVGYLGSTNAREILKYLYFLECYWCWFHWWWLGRCPRQSKDIETWWHRRSSCYAETTRGG